MITYITSWTSLPLPCPTMVHTTSHHMPLPVPSTNSTMQHDYSLLETTLEPAPCTANWSRFSLHTTTSLSPRSRSSMHHCPTKLPAMCQEQHETHLQEPLPSQQHPRATLCHSNLDLHHTPPPSAAPNGFLHCHHEKHSNEQTHCYNHHEHPRHYLSRNLQPNLATKQQHHDAISSTRNINLHLH